MMKKYFTAIGIFLCSITFASQSLAFNAQEYFESRCMACHNIGTGDLIGPDLYGVTDRRDEAWLIQFIRNSQELIASGDPVAVELYEQWDRRVMPAFNLSDDEIRYLLEFIEQGGAQEDDTVAVVVGEPTMPELYYDRGMGWGEALAYFFGALLMATAVYLIVRTKNKKLIGGIVGVFVLGGLVYASYELVSFARNTDYATGYAPLQPIAFSHRTHALDNEISCLYCHYGADKGIHGTIPPVSLCLNCHVYVATDSQEVHKVYDAIEDRQTIEWQKVHHFPAHARFNHSVHVNSELVSCQDCHGPVEEMDIVRQEYSLSMGFCLECHRQHDDAFVDGMMPDEIEEFFERGRVPGPLFDCATCHH